MPPRPRMASWDLASVMAYTLAVSALILTFGQGTVWAFLLIVFCPGYVLVAALFPGRGLTARIRLLTAEGGRLVDAARARSIDTREYRAQLAQANQAVGQSRYVDAIRGLEEANEALRTKIRGTPRRPRPRVRVGIGVAERLILTFGLSLAVVSLMGILLDLTPFGIALAPMVVFLLLFTLGFGYVAYERRLALPADDRFVPSLPRRAPSDDATGLDKALAVGLAASILFAAAAVVYIAVTPRPVERFTQLILLDRNGTADPNLYPSVLNASAPGTLIIKIVNNESASVVYTVRVDLVGLRVTQNATGANVTQEVNRTALDWYNVSLDNGHEWTQPFTFSIPYPGFWRLDFFVFENGNMASPSNHAFFYVRVT